MVLTPRSEPKRRQNTSCDPCRRSKRRCFFSPSLDDEAGTRCANCKRLGHTCTFEFAKAQSALKKRQKQKRNLSTPRQSREGDISNTFDRAVEGFTDVPSSQPRAVSATAQEVLPSWVDDIDFGLYVEGHATDITPALALPQFDAATAEIEVESRVTPLSSSSVNLQWALPFSPFRTRSIVGSSPNSAIYLLNSKLGATILDERLSRIYDTIVSGCASRFADYGCNSYATAHRYRLECRGSGSSELNFVPNSVPQFPTSMSPTDFSPSTTDHSFGQAETDQSRMTGRTLTLKDPGHMMTMLGTIRFLDHFSDLYGNRLTLTARRQSDAALKAVLRAFSLQWLSPTEPGFTTDDDSADSSAIAFHDAWFWARSLLSNAQSVRSFRIVYATLMFDGIVLPSKVGAGSTEPVVPHEFLDAGLEKLCYLDGLVKQYCVNLGPGSTYSALLEASLSVVRWGGYVRDIGAALTGDHQCKLPNASAYEKGSSITGSALDWLNYRSPCELDSSIPRICQSAVSEFFRVWREIIEVKNLVSEQAQSPTLAETIASTLNSIGKFNQFFRPFISACIENLEFLSIHSRTYCVSVILYWDLGVLLLAEILKPMIEGHTNPCDPQLAASIRTQQEEAVSSVARTAECVLSLPTEETFNLQNGLSTEVPITAYHITPSVTALVFQKAIESKIHLLFSPPLGASDLDTQLCGMPEPNPAQAVNGAWQRQTDLIMKGLSSLDATVGGSQAAGASFKLLMQRHGDILSECWSSDFST